MQTEMAEQTSKRDQKKVTVFKISKESQVCTYAHPKPDSSEVAWLATIYQQAWTEIKGSRKQQQK